ncbi:MAG: GGDEF domain-containing protein [Schwartzia sp.]|nr:GGDEF domain-containing protein [Schwartzia sp. (in: firmicutes)]
MNEIRRPLKYSIIAGCFLFVLSLCLVLNVSVYMNYRNSLFERHQAYVRDLLHFVASNLDIEDLKKCLATGQKSERFRQTQAFLDNIKDHYEINYVYVIIPVNTSDRDNIRNVIAGMSSYEKKYQPDMEVQLGGLTGTDYTAEIAALYYNAMNNKGEITYFEDDLDRFGWAYTGVLPLVDSRGEFFAELCVDVSSTKIHDDLRRQTIINMAVIVGLGVLFTLLFVLWVNSHVIEPIAALGRGMSEFAEKSHGQRDISQLAIRAPEIHSGNEIEALCHNVVKMADDIRTYVSEILETESALESAQNEVVRMNQLANKDALTGIRNKMAYDEELKKLTWEMESGQDRFGLAIVDLNFLKRINDTFGHDKGNVAIRKLCYIICHVFAHSPVFRIGGDEFAIILKGSDYENVDALIAEYYEQEAKMARDETLEYWEKISAAIGYSLFDRMLDSSVESVFKRADAAMYEKKRQMKAVRM